jgi:hypothetical protein
MATLKGDLRRCLENLPGGLLSHHDVILKLSLVVTKYTQDEQTAINIIERILSQISHRPNQPYEIRNAVRGAYIRHHNPNLPTNPIQVVPPDPSLKENNLGEHGLFEKYVLRSDLIPQNAAQAVAKLFRLDESIFVQKAVAERGALMAVSDWINQPDLDDYQFITYNCFPAQATNRSESQVEGRKYLLHETDDPSLSFEQQLGLIKRLETEAELKMIVNSGGKSLHAWFHWTPGNKASFLELSQKLGGDPRFKLMNQLCRLPWGTRKKECEPFPVRQEVIFWKE